MDYTIPPPDLRVRPLPGLHFDVLNGGKVEVCKEPPFSQSCQVSTKWLQDVNTVSNDLFIGRQYTRPKHSQTDKTSPEQEKMAPLQVNDVQPVN